MKRGVLRVIVINFLCISVVLYGSILGLNVKSYAIPQAENKEIIREEEIDSKISDNGSSKTESTTSSKAEITTSSVTSSKDTSSAKPVSAKAIKGNIISQYNSPYLASLNYDKVYVKNNTGTAIGIKKYLEGKISFKIKKNSDPQVLIYHTHATETFKTDNNPYYTDDFSSRSRDNSKNMISVGKIVAEKLNNAGIKTVQATTLHDYPNYTGSYSRSAKTIKEYTDKYPSIKVIIDLHRDAVSGQNGDKVKLVTTVNGKKAAQVMLVMGSNTGGITSHPKWEENFKLAVKLQQNMEKSYPTLARPILLTSKIYNQNMSAGALLLEIGTDVNTLEEAYYSAQMVGESLVKTLSSLS